MTKNAACRLNLISSYPHGSCESLHYFYLKMMKSALKSRRCSCHVKEECQTDADNRLLPYILDVDNFNKSLTILLPFTNS